MTRREPTSPLSRDARVDRLIAKFYAELEDGKLPQPAEYLKAHPDLANELQSFFEDYENVRSAIGEVAADRSLSSQNSSSWRGSTFRGGANYPQQVGDYRLLREIARGGMGVVYQAEQVGLRRVVALKMIIGGHLASEAQVDRFRREAMAAGGLKHANIVAVHDVGEHEGNAYYTMDFVDGECLADLIREGPMAPQAAAELLQTLAHAIQFAHEQGILHRDLKPANILVDREGQPHITDFGLAKSLLDTSLSLNDLTATGQILGTPSYMSPEQAEAKHERVSVASDIYSLGAILYACLSGRAPFVADSTVDTIRQVIEKDPVPIRLLSPKVPRDLETICLKCLSKEPHRRYASAEELANDLQRFLDRRPIRARRVNSVQKSWKWCRRRPDIAALVTLLFLGLIVGLTAVSFWWQMAEYAKLEAEEATLEAKRNLYASLMREAQSIRLARRSGYRDEVWKRLREASQIADIEIDPDAIREEAVACLGDFVGLKPVTIHGSALAGTNDCAVFLSDDRIAFSQSDGSISIRSISQSQVPEVIPRSGEPARAMIADPSGRDLYVVDRKSLQRWSQAEDDRWIIKWSLPADYSSLYMNLSLAQGKLAVITQAKIRLVDANRGTVDRVFLAPKEYSFRFPTHGFLNVALSPDGKFLAAADGPESVFVWNTSNEEHVQRISTSSTGDARLEFSADGRYLVVGSEEGITSYLTEDFSQWSICRTGAVRALQSSPDADYILVLTRSGSVQLWNTVTQTISAMLSHPGSALTMGTVGFSPSGGRILSAGNNMIRIWRINEIPEKRVLFGHTQAVQRVAFHPNAAVIASGGLDGKICFWDYRDGRLLHSVDVEFPVVSLAYSPNGEFFAATTQRSLRFWASDAVSPSAGHNLRSEINAFQDLCFSHDNRRVFTAGRHGVQEWRIESSASSETPYLISGPHYRTIAKSLAITTDDQFISYAWPVQHLQILRRESGNLTLANSYDYRHFANCVEADPNENRFYVATKEGLIQSIDAKTGQIDGNFHDEISTSATTVAIAPNGELLATDRTPTTVGLYEINSRRRIFALGDEGAAINSIAWGAQGRKLAVGLADGHIMVWDIGRILSSLHQQKLAGELNLFRDLPNLDYPDQEVTMFHQQLKAVKHSASAEDIADQIIVGWGISPEVLTRDIPGPKHLTPSIAEQVTQADGQISTHGITVLTLPLENLLELDAKLAAAGYKVGSVRPYYDGDRCMTAASWRLLDEDTKLAIAVTHAELQEHHAQWSAKNFQLLDLGAYLPTDAAEQELFFAIWREQDPQVLQQWWTAGEPVEKLDFTFSQLSDKFRPRLRFIYFDAADDERYCEVWDRETPSNSRAWVTWVDHDLMKHRLGQEKLPVRTISIAQTSDRSKSYLSFVSRQEPDKSHTHYIINQSMATFKRVNLAMIATGHFPRCVCVYRSPAEDSDDQPWSVAAVWEK